jgi:histidyl-tRNA synthetase
VGFATGLERIILNLKEQKIEIPESPKLDAFIAYLGEQAKVEAMKIALALRKAGIAIITATGDKSLKGQMRQANSLGAAYALILGEQEIRNQNVILRDMKSGEQKTIPVAEIARMLEQGKN